MPWSKHLLIGPRLKAVGIVSDLAWILCETALQDPSQLLGEAPAPSREDLSILKP